MPELRSPLTAQIVEWRVRPGDTVHATVTVKELFPEKCRVSLTTVCTVKGKAVIEGDALVMPTSRAARAARPD